MDSILDRWRPHYRRRAAEVEGRLANVFQLAFSREAPEDALTPREIFERKRDRLARILEPFVALADHAGC
jgi:hypothetical protein